ncbi:hypothetical protein WN51_10806 [Melipona quadrifasciata]|uniref:Uncharacterized protein n=1 Tax=Melipona quadrifasciata TaxID=166423 RepID=A0A0M9A4A5_9HYME|nr:hypothetical protein WN51_10806 [Melipona quadrifasciata]
MPRGKRARPQCGGLCNRHQMVIDLTPAFKCRLEIIGSCFHWCAYVADTREIALSREIARESRGTISYPIVQITGTDEQNSKKKNVTAHTYSGQVRVERSYKHRSNVPKFSSKRMGNDSDRKPIKQTQRIPSDLLGTARCLEGTSHPQRIRDAYWASSGWSRVGRVKEWDTGAGPVGSTDIKIYGHTGREVTRFLIVVQVQRDSEEKIKRLFCEKQNPALLGISVEELTCRMIKIDKKIFGPLCVIDNLSNID